MVLKLNLQTDLQNFKLCAVYLMILLGKHFLHHSCLNKFTFWYLILQKKKSVFIWNHERYRFATRFNTLGEAVSFSGWNSDWNSSIISRPSALAESKSWHLSADQISSELMSEKGDDRGILIRNQLVSWFCLLYTF